MATKPSLQRSERRAVFGALAAELGHDLQGPLNLLRMARGRLSNGQALDQEELLALGEEIERLAELSVRLRTLARTTGQSGPTSARALVEEALAARDCQPFVLDVSPGVELHGDRALLVLALRELIDNALDARRRLAGVRYELGERSGFCVWDDGPGFELDTGTALGWGASTKPDAAGMGLTLVLRVARAHGYRLEVARRDELTEVWLLGRPGAGAT
jgi:signal transduction histidine kinase